MWTLLVVDDDADLRNTVSAALSAESYRVDQAKDGEEAVNRIRANRYDMVLLDVQMPHMSGMEALKEIKHHDPSIIVMMLTAFSNIHDAVEATKQGAFNYLEKPIKAENLVYLVEKAFKAHHMAKNMSLVAPSVTLAGGTEAVSQDSEMKSIFELVDKLARVETAVLIRGESGTGKEWVARALHFNGPRKDNRFVTVNCSAIPESLMESEFFGHEKGAFTGADGRKIGKFQYADGGTLFLDEVGDLKPAIQVKLLRVLQEKRFTPLGSNREIEVQVRVVAATNRDLEDLVRKGEFREDLFYRLNVLPVVLPPLRERKQDVDALVAHFLERYSNQYQKPLHHVDSLARQALHTYEWPGNIRELEHVIERAVVLAPGPELRLEHLPSEVRDPVEADEDGDVDLEVAALQISQTTKGFQLDVQKLDFQANKEAFERQFLISALRAFRGRINQTALHANIPKKTLLRKLEKYGISAKDFS